MKDQPDIRTPASPDLLLRLDSTVIIALTSLWLYIVTSAYLNGYLSTFGCKPDWFEPSVFQLVSFSWGSIAVAASMAAIYNFLTNPFRRRSVWWSVFIIWALFIAGVGYLRVSFVVQAHWIVYLDEAFLICVPVASRLGSSWMIQVVDRHVPSDAAVSSLETAVRHLKIWGFIWLAFFICGFANTLGAVWGGLRLNTPPAFSAIAAEDLTRTIEVLYSDGTRTLTRESTATKGVQLFYRNPAASQTWRLTPAGTVWVPEPVTQPATPVQSGKPHGPEPSALARFLRGVFGPKRN